MSKLEVLAEVAAAEGPRCALRKAFEVYKAEVVYRPELEFEEEYGSVQFQKYVCDTQGHWTMLYLQAKVDGATSAQLKALDDLAVRSGQETSKARIQALRTRMINSLQERCHGLYRIPDDPSGATNQAQYIPSRLELTKRADQPPWQEQWGKDIETPAPGKKVKGGEINPRMPSFGAGQWVPTHYAHNTLQHALTPLGFDDMVSHQNLTAAVYMSLIGRTPETLLGYKRIVWHHPEAAARKARGKGGLGF